jgi:AcrR family transcriptional regulator
VSVGSLYQFFPNKDAVKEALINRYLDEMRQDKFELDTRQPISVIVRQMASSTFAFSQKHAGFQNLFLSQFAAARLHEQIMTGVDHMLMAVFPELSRNGRYQCAFMGVAIVKGVMAMAADAPDISEDDLLDEIVRAQLAYLRAVLLLEGIPVPRDIA